MVKYDKIDRGRNGIGSKLIKKSSKYQKIIKSWKTSKVWKVTKVIDWEKLSFLTSDTKLAFTKIGFNQNLSLTIQKYKELELLLEKTKTFSSQKYSSFLLVITNSSFVPKFIWKTHVLLLLQFWRYALEKNVLT